MKGPLISFLILAVATHVAHGILNDRVPPPSGDLHETLPSEEALALLSLTYEPLVADYYWFKAINEFGETEMHTARYPNLLALVERFMGA